MTKQITLGLTVLALLAGGALTRTHAINWPQTGFREWQTAFNPAETILEPLPDLFWWSGDVTLSSLAFRRGRAWAPVVVDAGELALPDPILVIGRQNQLVFYRPDLPRGLETGAQDPLAGTLTLGGTNGALQETGLLTTNPVLAESPVIPDRIDDDGVAIPASERLVFITHGLGVQQEGLMTDDPAYVQAVSISADANTFTATPLGKLRIQQPLTATTARETRVTGMTFADIGTAEAPLPFLYLTTADGQVICVDTRPFAGTTATQVIDPKTAIRWRWTNPGPRLPTTGTPTPPSNLAPFAPIPFNDGMNPAVGRVPLDGLPDLASLPQSARRENLAWQEQVRLRNREWVVYVADRSGNAWAIEAFGTTREEATNPGQTSQTLTGRATTRWRALIPGGAGYPARFGVPPIFWNGNTPTTGSDGTTSGATSGFDDVVVFPGVGNVVAFDAQGNFLTQDRAVFWNLDRFTPGAPPTAPGAQPLQPQERKLGEADGTTQRRWQFPETGATPPADGRFAVTVIRAMAGWTGTRQFDNNGADFANTAAGDDRIFIRWNELYVRPLDRAANPPVEPQPGESYVERLGALNVYGSIETVTPIDIDQPVTVSFEKTVGAAARRFTIPSQYLSIEDDFLDVSSTNEAQRSHRGRITIVKPVGLDNEDKPIELAQGDLVRVIYTSATTDNQRTENDVPYPSRRGRDVEPTIPGRPTPQAGELVPVSIGDLAVTIQEEAQMAAADDERIARPVLADDYNPLIDRVAEYALVPGMSVANDNIYLGSRYRGRLYVIEAASLLLRGQLFNVALESPDGGGAEPAPSDDLPAAIDPIGIPAIADGWLYVSYGNGYLSSFANFGGGGLGTDVEPPADGPFGREGSRRSAIPMPEIRVTDTTGNPITDESRLRFDWGQPIKIVATFDNFEADSLSLATNPIRVTIRGPMGDLPPVTVSPARRTTDGAAAGVAEIEVIIPNSTPSNPMTPGTPLLSEVPDISRRAGTAHWELRAEQIGTNWLRPDDTIGPWEPDRDAAAWNPARNTAPWFTLNNPIALAYAPFADQAGGPARNIGYLERFATAPAGRIHESKNGDPYEPSQMSAMPDIKTPTVITVGTDPASGRQLPDGVVEHGKASRAIRLGVVDRSDLGLRPSLGSLRVRVSLPKVTKLGFPLMDPGAQATGVPFGSVDQNYPDDGPDGYFPSIPGERLNVVKVADASNAASGAVSLRGVSNGNSDPNAEPVPGADGYETKVLQPEIFNISVDVPAHQPDGVYATRARLADPTTSSGSTPVPSPATAVDPRQPFQDFAPDDPNTDVNNPAFTVGKNDRTARVSVFVDANNNGRLDLQGNYREAYRTFAVQVVVRPDMRLEAAAVAPRSGSPSRLVDLGKMWHGFQTPTWQQLNSGSVDAAGRSFFEQYWKPFVLLNTGNTNLVNVKPELYLSAEGRPVAPVRLPSDGVGIFQSLTLLRFPPQQGLYPTNANQIYLRTSFDDRLGLGQGSSYNRNGAWLQKARPGSAAPGTGLYGTNPAATGNVPPYEPRLTLNIPMGTPLGTYGGDLRFFNDRQVVIVQDDSAPIGFRYQVEAGGNNTLLDRTRDPNAPNTFPLLEPAADPPLTVKVRVTENVAAGSVGDPSLRNQLGVQGGNLARTSPAAGYDLVSGRMFLFYSSNQSGLTNSPTQPLRFDVYGHAMPFDSGLGTYPFDPIPLQGGTWAEPIRFSDQQTPNNVVAKNTKPFFAQDQRTDIGGTGRQGYLFWHEDQATGPAQNQARIMYRRITPSVGDATVLAPGGTATQEGNVRQSPRAAAVPIDNDLRWFVFWGGSQQQKNNILFSHTADPETPASWSTEAVVPTSPSLATVSDATPAYVASTGTLWLFYNGFSQKLGRSDVYATKLDPTKIGSRQVVEQPDAGTTRAAYGLLGFAPRLGEKLRANATRTTFTSAGVDWRVNNQTPLSVFINGYVPLEGGGSRSGAQVNGLQVYVSGQLVSDLTYRGPTANGELNWSFRWPLEGGSTATVYLTVDPAAGTIRFSQPPGRLDLNGASRADDKRDPEVVADYIPGSLRLTNSELGATGGVGFTTTTVEPSWYYNTLENQKPPAQRTNGAAPIGAIADRLWAVWRRPGSATTLGPTLYYKTFRPAIQIIRPLRGPVGTFYQFQVRPADGKPEVPILQDVDIQDGVLYFEQKYENRKVVISVSGGGQTFSETHYIGWREEGGEAPVPMDVSVNEGTVTAFPLTENLPFVPIGGGSTQTVASLSKIWLFWTSTRGAGSDVFHATISPRITPLPR